MVAFKGLSWPLDGVFHSSKFLNRKKRRKKEKKKRLPKAELDPCAERWQYHIEVDLLKRGEHVTVLKINI